MCRRSCVLHRFVKNEWRVLSSQTIGVEFASKIVRVGTGARRKRIKLQLWDTAGTERFRAVSRSYYRGAAGAILIYDISSRPSFDALPTFLRDARALASPHLAVILAGNKNDLAAENLATAELPPTPSSASSRLSAIPLEGGSSTRSRGTSINLSSRWTATTSTEGREVSANVASRWASSSGVPVAVEVSALSGDHIDELFNRLAQMILTKIELGEIDPDDPQNGIQYGDSVAWDGGSGKTGGPFDSGLRRRRKNSLLGGVEEWEQVFRLSPRRRCC